MGMPGPQAPPPSDSVRRLAGHLVDPGDASTLDALATIADLRTDLVPYEEAVVTAARQGGQTWAEIGSVLGLARQNAQRKFSHLEEARSKR